MDQIIIELQNIEVGHKLKWSLSNGNAIKLRRVRRNIWVAKIFAVYNFLIGWAAPIVLIWLTRDQKLKATPFINFAGLVFWAVGVACLTMISEYFLFGNKELNSYSLELSLLLIALNLCIQLILLLPSYNRVLGELNEKMKENGC
jgi:hypothetical protein